MLVTGQGLLLMNENWLAEGLVSQTNKGFAFVYFFEEDS